MVEKMTVAELKSYLRLRDLKMTGKKSRVGSSRICSHGK